MPCNEIAVRLASALLWRTHWLAVVVQQPAHGRARPINIRRYQHPIADTAGLIEPNCPTVECSVVEGTQRQPVVDPVRTTVGVPLDVRGFEPQQVVIEAQVELTDRASTLLGSQHQVPKTRIAFRSQARLLLTGGALQPHGFQDVLVHRQGEVLIEDQVGSFANAGRVIDKQTV